MNERSTANRADGLDGIFSGGGSLGIAYVGALKAVQEHGLWFTRVAGTSAGAMVAALVAAGYETAELEWLFAPLDSTLKRPESLPSSITKPVDLSSFLDYPESSSDIDSTIMRKTYLWRAIKLNAVDDLLNRKLTGLPTREMLVNDLAERIAALPVGKLDQYQNRIKAVLNTALHFYPDDTPAIGSFVPIKLEHLREDIADAAWRASTNTIREYRLFVSWTFEGGFFEGKVLYRKIKSLLEAKVWESRGLPVRPVRFNDLPLELGIISVNTSHPDKSKRMQVHTRLTAGNMEVARAVRDSMSVPLFFKPRKYTKEGNTFEIMDGGVIFNFPFWLFTGGHDDYLKPSAADNARPKIGFILDKDVDASPDWGCPEPKWHKQGSKEGILPDNVKALTENPHFAFLSWGGLFSRSPFSEFIGVERALRVVDVFLASELTLTEPWRSSVKATYPYHEVYIPLKGYHWLDFTVNKDMKTWRGMVDRGYEATVRTLVDAGLIAGTARKKNPYRL
jgi:predicted acylesterase/phospholipase RssA